MEEMLVIGGLETQFSKAEKWVSRYVQSNVGVWSYPAYDSYPGSPAQDLAEQDLLATSLLNAHQKPITSYYSLKKLLPELNARLALLDSNHAGKSIASAGTDALEAIAHLFGVLDLGKTPQVGLTKLSKVLHRKRPHLIPLYDKNIRRVYFEAGDPPRLQYEPGRNWEGFALAWLHAVKDDHDKQADKWKRLADLAQNPPISPLRALDIVAWGLGETRNPPYEFSD